jgi:hypothetical protein
MGKLAEAEKYLNASWAVSQSEVIGNHLAQVYEQEHRKDMAVHMYRLALSASSSMNTPSTLMTELRAKITHLGGDINAAPYREIGELSQLRTVKLARLVSGQALAEFFIQFNSGSKANDVKFISGSDRLASADKTLAAIDFKTPFPDDAPASLVRRGVLACYPSSGCSFVMLNPNDVHSVN